MPDYLHLVFAIVLIPAACLVSRAQTDSSKTPEPLQVVVAVPSSANENFIVVPPATSWKGTIAFGASKADSSPLEDMSAWAKQQSALNGLQGLRTPWHVVITYDQFDEDGDNVHSGTYEELWAGPNKYKASYQSDDLHQTDFATTQGLYRLGDQQWPNRAQIHVPAEVLRPFFYAATLQGVQLRNVDEKFRDHTLNCALIEKSRGGISNPTQYCFEPDGSALRYSRGSGWYQTTYNDLTVFSERFVGKTVDVYDGGKPFLKLRVQRLEAVTDATDAAFVPPAEAKNLSGQVLTGVNPVPIEQSFPQWPDSLRVQHFSVTVEITIGKDGRVQTAHAISGPQEAFKAAEATARKWTFQPYMVLDHPAEVSTKIILSNN